MSKIISVSNQKGGVGKTTTAINLASALADKRKKILLVDIDPQGNATSGVGEEKSQEGIYKLLSSDVPIENTITKTKFKNLDLITSCVELAGIEFELMQETNKEYILKYKIEELKNKYDYIIIDCPPSLNILSVNALACSDSVIIPMQCEYFAIEGISQLLYTIKLIRERVNSNLEIEGIVFTMSDMRTNLASQVVNTVRENLKEYIFKTNIPRNIRLAEAPSYGQPINIYDKRSTGAKAYKELAKELIKKNK